MLFIKALLLMVYFYPTELKGGRGTSEKGWAGGQASEAPGSLSGPKVLRGLGPKPASSSSPQLSEIQITGPSPELLNQKLWGWGPASHSNKVSR